jgi:hypothetical protein
MLNNEYLDVTLKIVVFKWVKTPGCHNQALYDRLDSTVERNKVTVHPDLTDTVSMR